MGLACYEIVGNDREWRVRHDGQAKNVYETKEAAFEAAVPQRLLQCGKATRSRLRRPHAG